LSRFLRWKLSLTDEFLSSSWLESLAEFTPELDYPLQVKVEAASEVSIFSLLRY
jgi:hypothetical protein